MDILKRIPITYKGHLNDVRLINFSVRMEEVIKLVPPGIRIREFESGLAMISMVNVKLTKMHPVFIPEMLSFAYQHIGFRLLVDDGNYNNGISKGIFFIKSFTNKELVSFGGKLFTNYQITTANIEETNGCFTLFQGSHFLQYLIEQEINYEKNTELKTTIGLLDRAYSVINDRLMVTIIQREKWPIEWIGCRDFKTNFFESAKFLGAFQVRETIPYTWLPPKSAQ